MAVQDRLPFLGVSGQGGSGSHEQGTTGGNLQTRLFSIAVILSPGLRVFNLLIMTSIGTGYDLSASTYSPDGRIFQVNVVVGSFLLFY